jgi:hypothetical protein
MKTFLTTILLLFFASGFAQVDVSVLPTYTKTNNITSITGAHVYPDKIIIDFEYAPRDRYYTYSFYLEKDTYIEIPLFTTKQQVSGLINADFYTPRSVKGGKKAAYSAIFPFSMYALLNSMAQKNNGNLVLNSNDFPAMNIIEKSDEFFRENPNYEKSKAFNFYNVQLNLKPEQVEALYLSSLLDEFLKKGEFETTPAYTKRTSTDSVTQLLHNYITILERSYDQSQYYSMIYSKPTLAYNADKETFTITYPHAEPFITHVPLAQAPDFKNSVERIDFNLTEAILCRKTNGNFYIKQLVYTDSDQKKYTCDNLTVEDIDKDFQAVMNVTLGNLKKIYPKGKIWK